MLRFKSIFQGILLAYLVLILHMLLLAFVGILVLFFRGIINYMVWIFLIGTIITLMLLLYIYRKVRYKSKSKIESVKKLINNLKSNGYSFEVNFLGGVASFKLDQPIFESRIENINSTNLSEFKSVDDSRLYRVTKLAGLLEKKLITVDEYNEAKRDIFHF